MYREQLALFQMDENCAYNRVKGTCKHVFGSYECTNSISIWQVYSGGYESD
jgi:hypothetical protein